MGIKCSICGLESDREDWVGVDGPHCEIHDQPAAGAVTGQEHGTGPIQPPTINPPPSIPGPDAPAPPLPPYESTREGPVKKFVHEVEHKLHKEKEKPPTKKSGETF